MSIGDKCCRVAVRSKSARSTSASLRVSIVVHTRPASNQCTLQVQRRCSREITMVMSTSAWKEKQRKVLMVLKDVLDLKCELHTLHRTM